MNKPAKNFNKIWTTRLIRYALESGHVGHLHDAELHNDASYAFNGRTLASWGRVMLAIARARATLAEQK